MERMSLPQLREFVPQVPQELRALLAKVAEGVSSAMKSVHQHVAIYAMLVGSFDQTMISAGSPPQTFHPHPPLLVLCESGTPIDWVVHAIRSNAPGRRKTIYCPEGNPVTAGKRTTTSDDASAIHRVDLVLTEEWLQEANEGILVVPRLSALSLADQRLLHRALTEGFVSSPGDEDLPHWPPNVVVVAAERWSVLQDLRRHGNQDPGLWMTLSAFPPVAIPGLRDRPEDIPFFLQRGLMVRGSKWGISELTIQANFNEEALLALMNHEWPHNEEQLSSVIDRLLLTRLRQNPAYQLTRRDVEAALDFHVPVVAFPTEAGPSALARAPQGEPWSWRTDFPERDLRGAVKRFEKEAAEEALRKTGGNKKEAARLLGIDRHALNRILEGA